METSAMDRRIYGRSRAPQYEGPSDGRDFTVSDHACGRWKCGACLKHVRFPFVLLAVFRHSRRRRLL